MHIRIMGCKAGREVVTCLCLHVLKNSSGNLPQNLTLASELTLLCLEDWNARPPEISSNLGYSKIVSLHDFYGRGYLLTK